MQTSWFATQRPRTLAWHCCLAGWRGKRRSCTIALSPISCEASKRTCSNLRFAGRRIALATCLQMTASSSEAQAAFSISAKSLRLFSRKRLTQLTAFN